MGALRYLRLRLFSAALRPAQDYFRVRRMRHFARFIENLPGMPTVLDLGGQPEIWRCIHRPLAITILNLPGVVKAETVDVHTIEYAEGDACDLSAYKDGAFDIVFSNSVIEHVGNAERVARFASDARRVGRALWIQTPSAYFPIEAHTGMPFWWFYPKTLRAWLIRRWERKLPAWTAMVKGTTFVSRPVLGSLFPDCSILVERFMGMPKSYIAYRAPNFGQR